MLTSGNPFPLGALFDGQGTNFAVFSEVAEKIELCLFDEDGTETTLELPERTANIWHGYNADVKPGQRYGYRVHGPWDPDNGVRCNPAKLLMDPNATAIEGDVDWDESVFSHTFDDPKQLNEADSAAHMPKSIVTDRSFDWGDDAAPKTALKDTIVYEAHVKGFTKQMNEVPEDIRGTYAGFGHDASINYLKDLGITTVELLPVHHFAQDSHLLDEGLRNYWGYNSIGFLAPYSGYSASGVSGQQVNEFKSMVKALHAAGLEVILDVVYNHTAEGNDMGPTLSFKGFDNQAYYRLVHEAPSSYFDTTGTGNSFNVGHPAALRQIMDSLRYWVTDMHVDGFRFDLATTLTRQFGEVDQQSAFLDLVYQDPILAGVKLIAEPWDIGDDGYQVGGFPARWSEWNGKYRDAVRDYWRGEGSLGEFAQRLTGSPDIYGWGGRGPVASINFVTAHDGFTLADLTAYNEKHNVANQEDNNDGESNNSSWNCGEEGPTDNEEVNNLRTRQRKNFIATMLLSHGVPMLLGGDEIARTQEGNNNAYCQDTELSWFDWNNADNELLEFTKQALAIRNSHESLRPKEFTPDVQMLRPDGEPMTEEDWQNPINKALLVVFEDLAIAFNASEVDVEFNLGARAGQVILTSGSQASDEQVSAFMADSHSLTVVGIS